MSAREIVIQTEPLAEPAAAWLAGRCRLVRARIEESAFAEHAPRAAGLVVRTYTRVDEALLAKCPRLRVVGRAGVGLDNIDVGACRARGIEVVYTPAANTQAVVEYVICQVGALLRPPVLVREPLTGEQWGWLRRQRSGRRQMSEMTLGILGLGRIGSRLAEVAAAIGFARVLYNDLVDVPPGRRHGAEPVAVERLFEESDLLSLHVDGRASNRGLVGARLLERLGSDVIIVNTSRGFVVDSAALAGFLAAHPNATAVLDVHDPEPIDADCPLLGVPNARLLPHMAAATTAADLAMSWVVRDVAAVLDGRTPRHPAADA